MPSKQPTAYTRSGILRRFFEILEAGVPARIDSEFAGRKLGLKGGDIRAFLQSLRVFGFTDSYGRPTPLAGRARSVAERPAVVREALQNAYPALYKEWIDGAVRDRRDVEDHFKVRTGLSASSSSAAARLFLDLAAEYATVPAEAPRKSENETDSNAPSPGAAVTAGAETTAGRQAAMDRVMSSLQIKIDSGWDPDSINLVFDRLERLVSKVLTAAPGAPDDAS